jgi:hypothetical protein
MGLIFELIIMLQFSLRNFILHVISVEMPKKISQIGLLQDMYLYCA